ncbi:hypothetical protein RJ641_010851 [Dillenia turbinata]|uniref:Uncharacterized protein n=1 Tax=Dillenia turbinata TaxID=194707 RepID=A0AAN8Z2X1_9MAGN
MHRWAVNNLVNAGPEATELRFGCNNTPICPKPRRAGSTVPDILKQHTCGKHSQQITDGRSKILNMIAEKSNDGRESVCTGCSLSCYSGSPPGRTENPLVHDVQFVHQMEVLSPFTRTKLSDKFGSFTSASPI